MENINVALRVRPILSHEKGAGDFSCIDVSSNGKKIEVKVEPNKHESYKCAKCFAQNTSPIQFYEECGIINLLETAMKGSPVCIYAFGESGSGKSTVIYGNQKRSGANERAAGLLSRSIKDILEHVGESGDQYSLKMSCVEIINEQVFDILAIGNAQQHIPLDIVKTETGQYIIDNVTKVNCTRYTTALKYIEKLANIRYKQTSSTHRSHFLTELYIEIENKQQDNHNNDIHMIPNKILLSKISFIDLIESNYICHENQEKTENLKESFYDHSLYVLSKVIDGIERIDNNNTNIYDSILTKLLSQCIGIRSRCLLVSCIYESRHHMIETIKTLKFSCMHVPKQPKYLDPQAKLVFDLKQELHSLTRKNHQLKETMLLKPTWELHALSHTTSSAKYQEKIEEKKLINMHNDIIKKNNTYTFKPKNGGRLYFPSKITGKSIPIQKSKYVRAIEEFHNGSLYEKSSVFTELIEDSCVNTGNTTTNTTTSSSRLGNSKTTTTDREKHTTSPSIAIDCSDTNHHSTTTIGHKPHRATSTSPATTANHSISIDTLEDLLRHHSPPGPMVFRVKSPIQRSPETTETNEERIPKLSPLRETTRLGLGNEEIRMPLTDWPKVIRQRVSEGEKERWEKMKREEDKDVLERVIMQVEEHQKSEKTPSFSWEHEAVIDSPYVEHLLSSPKTKPGAGERPPFQVQLKPLDGSALDPPRPVTAPNRKEMKQLLNSTNSIHTFNSSNYNPTATATVNGSTMNRVNTPKRAVSARSPTAATANTRGSRKQQQQCKLSSRPNSVSSQRPTTAAGASSNTTNTATIATRKNNHSTMQLSNPPAEISRMEHSVNPVSVVEQQQQQQQYAQSAQLQPHLHLQSQQSSKKQQYPQSQENDEDFCGFQADSAKSPEFGFDPQRPSVFAASMQSAKIELIRRKSSIDATLAALTLSPSHTTTSNSKKHIQRHNSGSGRSPSGKLLRKLNKNEQINSQHNSNSRIPGGNLSYQLNNEDNNSLDIGNSNSLTSSRVGSSSTLPSIDHL